jgi:hypothetical protein
MSCDNCRILEKRIEQLHADLLQVEERRSREKTRHIGLEEKLFKMNLKNPSESNAEFCPSREDFIELLELLTRIVHDPSSECLEKTKAELEKYVL